MTDDPRAALTALTAAFERHLEVATTRRDPEDQAVMTAAEDLADAFLDYDEALFDATGVTTPLDGPYDDDDLDDEDDDDDDDEDDDLGDEDDDDDDDEVDEDDLDDDDDLEGDVIEDEVPPPGSTGGPGPLSR
jgi:hypothetical protein